MSIRDKKRSSKYRVFLTPGSNHEATYSVVPSRTGREELSRIWSRAAAGKKEMTNSVSDPNELRLSSAPRLSI